ncbi:MAG: tRNA threonylcarbamoyladenosine dehydratase [Pseudopedobacter saltans]|uniref:tRNA threonylcarbamoyladenosine dehydratase n=1 Tax=Pseudopedobacter saltans TaxID=151895 RepID=A0A2W5F457_9SPHI|nr:MAG: tRNA threonylcarbamoyladenosine dehydratase [Pseudopedobacter saltans]
MTDFSWLSRTELIVGKTGLEILSKSNVLVVGLGGVGSFAAEFLVRNGIGSMTIIDGDVVDPTNRNRQLPALATTHGQKKVGLMYERLKSINPELDLIPIDSFVVPDKVKAIFEHNKFDYIVDAIDSVTPKITFLGQAIKFNIPIVSSMGAGGRIDPTQIKVTDISKTYNCPFAQQVRKMLKKKGIYKGFDAVFSSEQPLAESLVMTDGSNYKKSAYGTMSYMPATFGAVCSSVVIRSLLKLSL